ncbi:MAG: ABC transporter permease [Anaerolineaceae bacterium]|nr:ABC transporter permease [Anaerolineaceae bacterium]
MSRVATMSRPDSRLTDTVTFRKRITRIVTIAMVVLLSVFVMIYVLLPIYWMVKSSFQTNFEIRASPPLWFPSSISFQTYADATTVIPIVRYMLNSLFVAGTTAILATMISAMAAYVLARFRFPFARLILVIILFTQLIPHITRVFPIYFFIQDLGLLNTYVGLIFAYTGFSIPYAVLMLQSYFRSSCPPELEEAGMIDGCGYFGAFRRIVLPVSMPGIAAIGTFTFLGAWNDFLWASLLLNRGEMKTLQVGLRDFMGEGGTIANANVFMAACVLATIPAVILFIFLQRHMVSGISAGAIKG